MAERTRGEQRFGSITYRQIAQWTGLTLSTVQSYGARGVIPKHDVAACVHWVNERRRRQGLPFIGVPGHAEDRESEPQVNSGGYNPQTGDYE